MLTVTDGLLLASGGTIIVGRNLTNTSVGGNITVQSGGGIAVGGNLNGLTVAGLFQGQASPSHIDLGVALNLSNVAVIGGAVDRASLSDANIQVGKTIDQVNIAQGIFDSWITAGVSISNVTVGPDGVTAIKNSELDAGASMSNLTANGDVASDFPTNASARGYPTRIVAGKTRSGDYLSGASINGFQINGALIDSVLAASVAPYGGDGSLPPPVPYGGTSRTVQNTPGDGGKNTYDAPGGVTDLGNGQFEKNYSIRSTINGQRLPVAVWDTTQDPTIDDTVLEGANDHGDGDRRRRIDSPSDDSSTIQGYSPSTQRGRRWPAPLTR